jgi:hypothetical protein
MGDSMSEHADEDDEDLCLCRKFVPEDKRVDVDEIVADPKTGKRGWKTIIRAHQDCPFHGIVVMESNNA